MVAQTRTPTLPASQTWPDGRKVALLSGADTLLVSSGLGLTEPSNNIRHMPTPVIVLLLRTMEVFAAVLCIP